MAKREKKVINVSPVVNMVQEVKPEKKKRVKKIVEKVIEKMIENVIDVDVDVNKKSPKDKTKKQPSGFALFVKQNYQSVKTLPNNERLKALSLKYKSSKSQN